MPDHLGACARTREAAHTPTPTSTPTPTLTLTLTRAGTPYIERFNTKTWSLDSTCIHGLASRRAGHVTVFPHAIAQGASWDSELIGRMRCAVGSAACTTARQGDSCHR